MKHYVIELNEYALDVMRKALSQVSVRDDRWETEELIVCRDILRVIEGEDNATD